MHGTHLALHMYQCVVCCVCVCSYMWCELDEPTSVRYTHAHAHTEYTILYPLIIRHQHGWQPAIKHAQLIFKSYQRYLMLLHTVTPAKCQYVRVCACVYNTAREFSRTRCEIATILTQRSTPTPRQRSAAAGRQRQQQPQWCSCRCRTSGCLAGRPTCVMCGARRNHPSGIFFSEICVLSAEPKIVPINAHTIPTN